MTREQMIAKINEVVSDVLELDPSELQPRKALKEYKADSLAIIEIAEGLEEAFESESSGFRFEDTVLEQVICLDDLYDIVGKMLGINS